VKIAADAGWPVRLRVATSFARSLARSLARARTRTHARTPHTHTRASGNEDHSPRLLFLHSRRVGSRSTRRRRTTRWETRFRFIRDATRLRSTRNQGHSRKAESPRVARTAQTRRRDAARDSARRSAVFLAVFVDARAHQSQGHPRRTTYRAQRGKIEKSPKGRDEIPGSLALVVLRVVSRMHSAAATAAAAALAPSAPSSRVADFLCFSLPPRSSHARRRLAAPRPKLLQRARDGECASRGTPPISRMSGSPAPVTRRRRATLFPIKRKRKREREREREGE